MPITFDTLEELQEFYLTFKLENPGKALTGIRKAKRGVGRPKATATKTKKATPGRKPGRPPKAKATALKPAAKPGRKPGRPAKAASKKVVALKPKSAVKKAASKVVKPKLNRGETLTGKIQATIQKFLDSKKAFTANDIYADISQRDKAVNKQSVITSVLKQMNSTFKQIKFVERPGAGPRAVKQYTP